jgi:hypothetical protein
VLCLNSKLPWTIARWTDVPGQYGLASFKLSICRVGFRTGGVKGTIVLPVRELKAYLLNQIGGIKDSHLGVGRPSRPSEWSCVFT